MRRDSTSPRYPPSQPTQAQLRLARPRVVRSPGARKKDEGERKRSAADASSEQAKKYRDSRATTPVPHHLNPPALRTFQTPHDPPSFLLRPAQYTQRPLGQPASRSRLHPSNDQQRRTPTTGPGERRAKPRTQKVREKKSALDRATNLEARRGEGRKRETRKLTQKSRPFLNRSSRPFPFLLYTATTSPILSPSSAQTTYSTFQIPATSVSKDSPSSRLGGWLVQGTTAAAGFPL